MFHGPCFEDLDYLMSGRQEWMCIVEILVKGVQAPLEVVWSEDSSDKDTAPSAEEMKAVPKELEAVDSDTIVSVLCAALGHLVTFIFLERN
jgi:hypothetical protein